jgi:hypothetical protein
VAKGSTLYASGYGVNASNQNEAFVQAYNAKTGALLGKDNATLDFENGLITTGLAVGKQGVYLAGFGESAAQTSWVVRAYDLKLIPTWQRVFGGLNGGTFAKAQGIGVGAKAVIAVGQVQDGETSPIATGLEAYTLK